MEAFFAGLGLKILIYQDNDAYGTAALVFRKPEGITDTVRLSLAKMGDPIAPGSQACWPLFGRNPAMTERSSLLSTGFFSTRTLAIPETQGSIFSGRPVTNTIGTPS